MISAAENVGVQPRWAYAAAALIAGYGYVAQSAAGQMTSAGVLICFAALVCGKLAVGRLSLGDQLTGRLPGLMLAAGAAWVVASGGAWSVGGWLISTAAVLCLWTRRGSGAMRAVLLHVGILFCLQAAAWQLLLRIQMAYDAAWAIDPWVTATLVRSGWAVLPSDAPATTIVAEGWTIASASLLHWEYFVMFGGGAVYWLTALGAMRFRRLLWIVGIVALGLAGRLLALSLTATLAPQWLEASSPWWLIGGGLLLAALLPAPREALAPAPKTRRWALPAMAVVAAASLAMFLGFTPSGRPRSGRALIRSGPAGGDQPYQRLQLVIGADWQLATEPLEEPAELTEAVLAEVDVLVLSGANLNRGEQELVAQRVREGMGMLLLVDPADIESSGALAERFGLHLSAPPTSADGGRSTELRQTLCIGGRTSPPTHALLRDLPAYRCPPPAVEIRGGWFAESIAIVPQGTLGVACPIRGVEAGRGRVIVANAADLFAEPAVLLPGPRDLLRRSIDWLNRSTLQPQVKRLAFFSLLASGAVLLVGSGGAGQTICSLTFALAFALSTLAVGWYGPRQLATAEPASGGEEIVFWSYRTALDVPGADPPRNDPLAPPALPSQQLFAAPARLGLVSRLACDSDGPWPTPLSSDGSRQAVPGQAIVIVEPAYYYPQEVLDQLQQHVKQGGRLLVLITAEAVPEVVETLLFDSGLQLSEELSDARALVAADGRRVAAYTPFRVRPIQGGQPLLRDEHQQVVAARQPLGGGWIVCATLAGQFTDDSLGGSDAAARQRRELADWLLQELTDTRPAVTSASAAAGQRE